MEKIIVNNPDELQGFRVVQRGEDIKKALENGETIMHWESGDSMFPLLKNMEYCKITPVKEVYNTINIKGDDFFVGKPVFCSFDYNGMTYYMVHRCTEVYRRYDDLYFKIESTDNQCFGWTKNVYGIAESTNIFQDESILWQN